MRSSESVTLKLGAALRGAGHVDVEHFLVDGRRRAGPAPHPRVRAGRRVGPVPGTVLLLRAVQRTFVSGVRLRLEALQLDGVLGVARARQQHGHVLTELGAEAKVDERVVEAGRLGEEAGEDAGEVGHVEAPRRPHGHHGVRRPRQDEGRTDHYGNLQETRDGPMRSPDSVSLI